MESKKLFPSADLPITLSREKLTAKLQEKFSSEEIAELLSFCALTPKNRSNKLSLEEIAQRFGDCGCVDSKVLSKYVFETKFYSPSQITGYQTGHFFNLLKDHAHQVRCFTELESKSYIIQVDEDILYREQLESEAIQWNSRNKKAALSVLGSCLLGFSRSLKPSEIS